MRRLNTDVPDETLEAVPFPVRLGRLDLIPGDDGKARLFGGRRDLGHGPGFCSGRPSHQPRDGRMPHGHHRTDTDLPMILRTRSRTDAMSSTSVGGSANGI